MGSLSATSSKETWIYERVPYKDTNYGTETLLHIASDQTSARRIRSIIGFDTTNIPTTATIDTAVLTLVININGINDGLEGETIWAYKCTQAFVDLEATWNDYASGSAWTAAGGDYVTSSPAGESVVLPANNPTAVQDLDFTDVIAIVQDAVTNGVETRFLIRFDDEDIGGPDETVTFHSGEMGSYEPALVITYSGEPTVTTQECTKTIAEVSIGHGNLTSIGNAAVTQHGHCWGTSSNPTTALSTKTTLGAKPNLGQFQSNITDLTPGTKYYVRAYATNSVGTSYGANVEIAGDVTTIGRRHWWTEFEEFHYFGESGAELVLRGTPTTSDHDGIMDWM